MKNFERIAKDIHTLSNFLYAVQDDALEAKGCSFDLKLPPTLGEDEISIDWETYLGKDEDENWNY